MKSDTMTWLSKIVADLDLDLSSSEDRAIFRQELQRKTQSTLLEKINEWTGRTDRSRNVAVRALADAYIDGVDQCGHKFSDMVSPVDLVAPILKCSKCGTEMPTDGH